MTNQRPAEALRQLTDFLQTLKVHNTDLDACFNDAVAVSHLEKLVTAYAATVEREARQATLTEVFHRTPTPEMVWKQLSADRLRQEWADMNRYLDKELGINQPKETTP